MQEGERQTGMDVRGLSQQPRGQVSSEGRERFPCPCLNGRAVELTTPLPAVDPWRCGQPLPSCFPLASGHSSTLFACANFSLLISSVFATYVIGGRVMG